MDFLIILEYYNSTFIRSKSQKRQKAKQIETNNEETKEQNEYIEMNVGGAKTVK